MRKQKILKLLLIIFSCILLFFAGFKFYLESGYMKNDYACEVSEDGKWEVYLIPDHLGMISGYLIYLADIEKIQNVQVEGYWDGEEFAFEDIPNGHMGKYDSYTAAQKYVLNKKTYYQFFEYGNEKADVDVQIIWNEEGEERKTDVKVKYDKFNPYDFWCDIKDYLGILEY